MPKEMKTIRTAPRPQPASRPIKSFVQPSRPKVNAMSPGAPKIAADLKPSPSASELIDQFNRIANNPPGIDPRQMHKWGYSIPIISNGSPAATAPAPQPQPPAVPTTGKIPGYADMSFAQKRLAQDQLREPQKIR